MHLESISYRLPAIAEARGISRENYAKSLCVLSVRGWSLNTDQMSGAFADIPPGRFKLIVIDPLFRALPPRCDENSNGDMARVYNSLNSIAEKLDCAIVVVHHSSKGNQSGKSVTDTGSGAGAQSRAADTHLVFREHDENNVMVVEPAIRSFKPMAPFCVRWQEPVWNPATDLDPRRLKQERPRREKTVVPGESKEDQRKQTADEQRLAVIKEYLANPDGQTMTAVRDAVGMSGRVFGPINSALISEGLIQKCKISKSGRLLEGFRINPLKQWDNPDKPDDL